MLAVPLKHIYNAPRVYAIFDGFSKVNAKAVKRDPLRHSSVMTQRHKRECEVSTMERRTR